MLQTQEIKYLQVQDNNKLLIVFKGGAKKIVSGKVKISKYRKQFWKGQIRYNILSYLDRFFKL